MIHRFDISFLIYLLPYVIYVFILGVIQNNVLTKNEPQTSGKQGTQKTIPATMIIKLALPLQKT